MVTEYKRAYLKKWQATHPEKMREADKKYRVAHREKRREHQRKWHANNPKYAKTWQINNHFGSLERHEEAMQKYDGWCAFACDEKAELVHHLDGKAVHNSPKENVDNSLRNLLPLCRSCHMKLHRWKK